MSIHLMLLEGIPERVKVGSLPTRISVVCRDVEQWFNRTQCEFERVAPLTGVTGIHPLLYGYLAEATHPAPQKRNKEIWNEK